MARIRGSCLCGLCRYEASGPLFDVVHCHCTDCRKRSGSAFSTYGGVSRAGFRWCCDGGDLIAFDSSASVARYSCRACGALLTSVDAADVNTVYLSVGLLDTDTAITAEYHQFVASKAAWFEIADDLPQYPRDP